MDLVPGQTLIFVPFDPRRGKPVEVTVERVGRKWAYLSGHVGRIDDDLIVDGGNYGSPGRCYGSWAEYEETTALAAAWKEFWLEVNRHHRCPDGLTVEQINAARMALGLPDKLS